MAQVALPTVTVARRRRGLRGILREMRREWTAYLFNAPGLVLFGVFTVYAVYVSFYLSFHQWDIIQAQKAYVGLRNYREVFHDGAFWAALGHTLYFTVGSIVPTLAISLFLALLLTSKLRAVGLFRTAYYLPAITPLVIASLIWKWVYNGDFGLDLFCQGVSVNPLCHLVILTQNLKENPFPPQGFNDRSQMTNHKLQI